MTKKYITIALTFLALELIALALMVKTVSADGCGQYGQPACPPTDLTVNKQVKHPVTGVFLENLVASDDAYSPGATVTFLLKITNSSNRDFSTVSVTDTLSERMVDPRLDEADKDKVTDVKNPDSRTLVFVLKEALKAGETREVKVTAKVVTDFPSTKDKFCGSDDKLENKAVVKAEDRTSEDKATLCVVTKVAGAKELPEAGPVDYLPVVPFIASGFIGIALIVKRSKAIELRA